jgi:hypothetical protein
LRLDRSRPAAEARNARRDLVRHEKARAPTSRDRNAGAVP